MGSFVKIGQVLGSTGDLNRPEPDRKRPGYGFIPGQVMSIGTKALEINALRLFSCPEQSKSVSISAFESTVS